MGYARTAAVWRGADHEYPQRPIATLARLAQARKSLRRSVHIVLRICGHEATENSDMVRVRRDTTARNVSLAYGRPGRVRAVPSRGRTGDHQFFGFLTTDADAEVATIYPKAMPVILRTDDEIETWMTAPAEEALKLQRPLPNGALKVVMTGEKEDKT